MDGLITKWDESGNLLWFKQARGYFGQCHAVQPNAEGASTCLDAHLPKEISTVHRFGMRFYRESRQLERLFPLKPLSTNLPVWRLARDRIGNSYIGAELPPGGTDFCGVALMNESGSTVPLVAKLDPAGNLSRILTGLPAGTNAGYANVWGLAVTPNGVVYLGGLSYYDFDLNTSQVQSADGYIGRIDPDMPALHIARSEMEREYRGLPIKLTSFWSVAERC